jgi:hypothetical protein
MAALGKVVADAQGLVGTPEAGAYQRSDEQDVVLPKRLKGDDLHGSFVCLGGGLVRVCGGVAHHLEVLRCACYEATWNEAGLVAPPHPLEPALHLLNASAVELGW